jgi:hypothetical protein
MYTLLYCAIWNSGLFGSVNSVLSQWEASCVTLQQQQTARCTAIDITAAGRLLFRVNTGMLRLHDFSTSVGFARGLGFNSCRGVNPRGSGAKNVP